MIPNLTLINSIQEELHEAFYSSHIPELSRREFKLEPPRIILEEKEPDSTDDDGLFDVLGYFRPDKSDAIYLCPQKIEKSALRHKVEPAQLASIIYIHETAHYFHFHARQIFHDSPFAKMTTLFGESFAQLLTHRVCQKFTNMPILLSTFLKLTEGQSIEYRQYKISHEYDDFLGFDKFGKMLTRKAINEVTMHRFSADSIVKTFVVDELVEKDIEIVNQIKKNAENTFVEKLEGYEKSSYEYGLLNFDITLVDKPFIS
jgi:hypothetical protein